MTAKMKRKVTIIMTTEDDEGEYADIGVEIFLDPPCEQGKSSAIRTALNQFLKIMHDGAERIEVRSYEQ